MGSRQWAASRKRPLLTFLNCPLSALTSIFFKQSGNDLQLINLGFTTCAPYKTLLTFERAKSNKKVKHFLQTIDNQFIGIVQCSPKMLK
jgi:hypothetical protein